MARWAVLAAFSGETVHPNRSIDGTAPAQPFRASTALRQRALESGHFRVLLKPREASDRRLPDGRFENSPPFQGGGLMAQDGGGIQPSLRDVCNRQSQPSSELLG